MSPVTFGMARSIVRSPLLRFALALTNAGSATHHDSQAAAIEGDTGSTASEPLGTAALGCSTGSGGVGGSATEMVSSDREDPEVAAVCEEGPDRTTPLGVMSNAQASPRAIGKPNNVKATTSVRVQSCRLSAGNRTSAAWITTNPATTYVIATRTTWRRFSSDQKDGVGGASCTGTRLD